MSQPFSIQPAVAAVPEAEELPQETGAAAEAGVGDGDEGPGALDLAALIASKVCHDLINPVGALNAGLEVLEDEKDPEMRAEALRLIGESARKAVAGLSFARLAYGAGGAYGAEIDFAEAEKTARDMFSFVRPELEWRVSPGLAPKDVVKASMSLAIAASECIPRGGLVTAEGDAAVLRFTAEGPKARVKDAVLEALAGEGEGLEPKLAPLFIAGEIARSRGGEVRAVLETPERVVVTARFAPAAAR